MGVEGSGHGLIRDINPLNAELNPIFHLLALLGGATIVVVSRLRVKSEIPPSTSYECHCPGRDSNWPP